MTAGRTGRPVSPTGQRRYYDVCSRFDLSDRKNRMSNRDPDDNEPGPVKARRASLHALDVGLTISESTVRDLLEELRRLIRETVREEFSQQNLRVHESKNKDDLRDQPKTLPGGIELPTTEQLKANDLRMALLLGKLPEDSGLLIDTNTTAKLLSITRRTLDRMVSAHEIPPPIRITGRMKRWRLTELLEWIEAGCPHPNHWSYSSDSGVRRKLKK
jgi:predicted DNA-binding transcriptional regulator AlpA